jgi:hypothetical protein
MTALALMSTPPAHATITFTLGNHPQPNEENVLFTHADQDQFGPTVNGVTNQSGVLVAFSTQATNYVLHAPSAGQADLNAVVSQANPTQVGLTDLTITVPGATYGDLIINPVVGQFTGGTAHVTVIDNTNTAVPFDYALGTGSNFLTIVATNGESIKSVNISNMNDASFAFGDLQQPRISGPFTGNPTIVPEPSTIGIALSGLVTIGLAALCRRRLTAKASA